MTGPFRAGWQMDYPLIQNFLSRSITQTPRPTTASGPTRPSTGWSTRPTPSPTPAPPSRSSRRPRGSYGTKWPPSRSGTRTAAPATRTRSPTSAQPVQRARLQRDPGQADQAPGLAGTSWHTTAQAEPLTRRTRPRPRPDPGARASDPLPRLKGSRTASTAWEVPGGAFRSTNGTLSDQTPAPDDPGLHRRHPADLPDGQRDGRPHCRPVRRAAVRPGDGRPAQARIRAGQAGLAAIPDLHGPRFHRRLRHRLQRPERHRADGHRLPRHHAADGPRGRLRDHRRHHSGRAHRTAPRAPRGHRCPDPDPRRHRGADVRHRTRPPTAVRREVGPDLTGRVERGDLR